MAITVVLAVGWDPWLLAAQDSAWRAAGYIAVSVSSISEAFRHFKAGDFDLVVLGNSISREERQRLTRQIRDTGAKAPVIDISDVPIDLASVEKVVGETTLKPMLISSAKWPQKQEGSQRLAS
jgi:DNA-binding response OmpR family regulator